MSHASKSAEWLELLECARAAQHRVSMLPGLGRMAIGLRRWDTALLRMGREWLADHPNPDPPNESSAAGDVYLATQIFPAGGHTALIGDFVRALASPRAPHLILTNLNAANSAPLEERIWRRTEIPPENITLLLGPSIFDRMEELFARLRQLRPKRLFLFHHPEDPLAGAVAQPEIAPACVFVHHADSTPSLGLHLPGIELIDLNPGAVATSRLLGLTSSCLPLTAPDPGPRPHGFLRRGSLVTATSGSAPKFNRAYAYSYPETVGVILDATRGWHLHIGPLDENMQHEISEALRRRNIVAERFIYLPWSESVAKALWQHEVDLYCASFPVDGARARVEVLASATPYLAHSTRALPANRATNSEMLWDNWAVLTSILHRAADQAFLAEQSRAARAQYDEAHHPRVFRSQLENILAGRGGRGEGTPDDRDLNAIRGMLRSVVEAVSDNKDLERKSFAALRDKNAKLQARINELERRQKKLSEGSSWRARLRHWLLRS